MPNNKSDSIKVKMESSSPPIRQENNDTNEDRDEVEAAACAKLQDGSTKDFQLDITFDSDDSDWDEQYYCTTCKKSFSGMKPLRQHQKSGKHAKAVRKKHLQKEIDDDLEDAQEDSDEDIAPVLNKPYAECEVCGKEFTGPESYRQHIKSKTHVKKVHRKKLLDQVKEDGKVDVDKLTKLIEDQSKCSGQEKVAAVDVKPGINSDSLDFDDNILDSDVLECKECLKEFNGPESFASHITSKSHRKVLKQKELLDKLKTKSVGEGDDVHPIDFDEEVLVCKMCQLSFSGPENASAHLKSRGHKKILEFHWWKEEQRKSKDKMAKEKDLPLRSADDKSLEENSEDVKSENSEIAASQSEMASRSTVLDKDKLTEEDSKNTLIAYESYKKYKKIMNALKTEESS